MNYNKRIITYEEYGTMVKALAGMLYNKYDYIYGPLRGAWPIVTHLSHWLNVPVKDKLLFDVDEYVNGEVNEDRYLIADDIADKGKTLIEIESLLREFNVKNVTYVTLFYKKRSRFKPDVYIKEISDDTWIVFPWEKLDEEPNR